MRNLVKLVTLPLLIIAIGFLPAAAEESLALVHPGIDGVTPPKAKAKSRVDPYYPATAKASRAEGAVVVAATVLRDGSVGDLEVVACNSPNFGFEESALSAVRMWDFEPATKDGEAVNSYTLVHLYFAPPSGRMGFGSVRSNTFLMSDLPTGLPGAPSPVISPISGPIGTAGDGGGRPVATPLLIPCAPGGGKCLYDREELLLEAKRRQGEGGVIRPLSGPRTPARAARPSR